LVLEKFAESSFQIMAHGLPAGYPHDQNSAL